MVIFGEGAFTRETARGFCWECWRSVAFGMLLFLISRTGRVRLSSTTVPSWISRPLNFTFREANFVLIAATHSFCLLLMTLPLNGTNPPPARLEESVASALTSLSATSASQRVRAERWLATHLEVADYPELRDAAISGSSEVRLRITHALGSDDRHLGLAISMAANQEAALKRLGEEAVGEIAARWHTGLGQPFAADLPDQPQLREAMGRLNAEWPTELYRLELSGSLSEVVSRLARLGNVPVPLIVDPYTEGKTVAGLAQAEYLEGTWDELLRKLAVKFGVKLEGALIFDEKLGQVPALLCLRPSDASSNASALSLLTDWCRDSLGANPSGSRAARALATSTWPAALGWLDRRYRETKDEVALAGLLSAAARDRIPLCFSRAEAVRELLELAEVANSDLSAVRIMQALMALPPVGLDGERLDEVLIENLGTLNQRTLLLRLNVLESMTSSSSKVRAALREVLARPEGVVDTVVRLQALRAWSSMTDHGEVELAGLPELLRSVRNQTQAAELVGLLLAARVAPEAFQPASDKLSSLSLSARTMLLEWNLLFGRSSSAGEHLEQLTNWKSGWPKHEITRQAHAQVAEALRRLVRRGEGDRVGLWLDALFRDVDDPDARRALHRIAILAGVTVTERALRDAACLNWLVPADQQVFPLGDEELLGVLAARKVAGTRSRARALLLQQLGRALSQHRSVDINGRLARQALLGLERAIEELFERGADYEVKLLASEIEGLLRRYRSHPLAEQVFAKAWPFGPSSRAIDLASSDRSL
ncbi:MAG: hypothetical protein ACI87A_002360 [Planctomycetota bacterium]|jgi:hypothetical protein